MPTYEIYPGVDENLQFAPEVREALLASPDVKAAFDAKIDSATAAEDFVTTESLAQQKGASNGLAFLNADQKIPASILPDIFGGGTLSGRFIDRPAADTVVDGTVYFSIDTTETYRSNTVDWVVVGSGGTLGTAVLMTEWGTTSTDVLVPVPGLSVGFIAPVRGVKVTVSGQWKLVAGANAVAYMVVAVNGGDGPHIVGRWAQSDTEINYSRTAEIQDLIPGKFSTIDVKVMIDYRNPGHVYLGASDYNPHNLIVEAL